MDEQIVLLPEVVAEYFRKSGFVVIDKAEHDALRASLASALAERDAAREREKRYREALRWIKDACAVDDFRRFPGLEAIYSQAKETLEST